mmetsp:Transcript_64550/g.203747  ORF Transcript_64550/g.203747 Transcript_64550/m.203747 type:complete len:193 (+) Transcript_64550:718-1296(+)
MLRLPHPAPTLSAPPRGRPSSSAVYKEDSGGVVVEGSETFKLGDSDRSDRLLSVEAVVGEAGGTVVRLAGLYTATRGAHMYFLKVPEVKASPDGYLNLIHYEDAASLAMAAALRGERGGVYMGCDNHPVTRAGMMEALLATGKYGPGPACAFLGPATGGASGKRMDDTWTREALGWAPAYDSWDAFLAAYDP